MIIYGIALKEVLQGRISRLSFCNFLSCSRACFFLISAITKHCIHMKAVSLCWHAALVAALQMVCKQLPIVRTQFLGFHTKRCMGVIGCIELGIMV
jgi:hypothetical protein